MTQTRKQWEQELKERKAYAAQQNGGEEYDDRFFTKVKPGVYEQTEESNPYSDGLIFITEYREAEEYYE